MQLSPVFVVLALIGSIHCSYPHQGNLISIAQGSANQAHSAVASQHVAAQRASYVAKSGLAQHAAQAAGTAQAALAGKHDLLQNLQQQKQMAETILNEELVQLQSAEKLARTSSATADSAAKQIMILRRAAENAEQLAKEAGGAAAVAAREFESQNLMVGASKASLNAIEHRLAATRADFLATKEAAQKAANFAQKAQQNAADVGSHVAAAAPESGKPGNNQGHGGHFH